MSQSKVAIYARVSTEDQSPDAQLMDLREYAKNRGWSEVKEFVDVGWSGSRDRRPAWNDCWDALQRGKINVLVVHALDRVGRSMTHLVKVLATMMERQITLISYRENIDLSTAAGRLLANLISVLADFELALICERTAAGMRAAKARGSKIGNQKRFFDKVEATRLRDQGWGKVRIARQLRVGVGTVHRWCREEYQPPGLRNGHHED